MAEEKITKWLCSHCGEYSETEIDALRCCTGAHPVTKTKEEWDEYLLRMKTLKDKLQNAYDDIPSKDEPPLYKYYDENDVKEAILEFEDVLNAELFKLKFEDKGKLDFCINEFKIIFGNWEK